MGFLEDEKRRQAAKLDVEQRSRALLVQQAEEKRQREASEEIAEKTRIAKSAQHFKQSGLGEMIKEAGKLGLHHDSNLGLYGDNSMQSSVRITVRPTGNGNYKVIDIDTTPDGTITIQGGLFGSTTLPKYQWSGKDGKEVLEKALGKAYKHPRSIKDKPSTYSHPAPPSDYSERAGPGL